MPTTTPVSDDLATVFSGVWSIAPTPFDADGHVDQASFPGLMRYLVGSGVSGITALGVAGEASRLTDAERALVVEKTVAACAGHVPVCVGVTGGSTMIAVAHARTALAAGAKVVMLSPTPGMRPDDSAILAHYKAVLDAVDVPIVIQDHPAYSGVRMSIDLLAKLIALSPRLRVVKLEASPTPPKINALRSKLPQAVVLGGLGGLMLIEELRQGANGTMTGFACQKILADVVRLWRAGNTVEAVDCFERNSALIRFENQEPLALAIRKEIYRRLGAISHATVRSPGASLDPVTRADLDQLLSRTNFLEEAKLT